MSNAQYLIAQAAVDPSNEWTGWHTVGFIAVIAGGSFILHWLGELYSKRVAYPAIERMLTTNGYTPDSAGMEQYRADRSGRDTSMDWRQHT